MIFYEQRCEIQIARRARTYQSDLLVLVLHIHSLLFIRLWNHTTHDPIQQLSSSFLGGIERWEPPHFSRLRSMRYQMMERPLQPL